MLYLPGSTLQLVSGGPLVVFSGEERDGAFIVVVTQKGFYPWNTKHSVDHVPMCFICCVYFNTYYTRQDN